MNGYISISSKRKHEVTTVYKRSRVVHLSVLKMRAISGTRGSSGLGSQSREQTESRTLISPMS